MAAFRANKFVWSAISLIIVIIFLISSLCLITSLALSFIEFIELLISSTAAALSCRDSLWDLAPSFSDATKPFSSSALFCRLFACSRFALSILVTSSPSRLVTISTSPFGFSILTVKSSCLNLSNTLWMALISLPTFCSRTSSILFRTFLSFNSSGEAGFRVILAVRFPFSTSLALFRDSSTAFESLSKFDFTITILSLIALAIWLISSLLVITARRASALLWFKKSKKSDSKALIFSILVISIFVAKNRKNPPIIATIMPTIIKLFLADEISAKISLVGTSVARPQFSSILCIFTLDRLKWACSCILLLIAATVA